MEEELRKIEYFCQHQERSQKEVRKKLYEIGCDKALVEELVTEMIEKGLVNEERYAKAIVRGKFHVKQWGRNKIIQRLKQQGISEYCIKIGLKEIDEVQYIEVLKKLVEKKWAEEKAERNKFIRMQKVFSFLFQKGYESTYINDVIKDISEKP